MVVIQFLLLFAILVIGYIGIVVTASDIKRTSPKKKSLILPTYGDESPEEVARMIEEVKKFNNPSKA